MNRILLARLVVATVNKWYDILTRAALLEGAAGAAQMAWVGGSAGTPAGLSRVMDKASAAMPGMDPAWLLLEDTGMFSSMLRAARSGGLDRDAAMELVTSIVGGVTRGQNEGHLWQTGRHFKNQIEGGAAPSVVMSHLLKHAKSRALDIRKKKVEQSISLTQESEEGGVQQRDVAMPNERTVFDAFLDLLQDPATRGVFFQAAESYFSKILGNAPGALEVLRMWLNDPSLSATQIALAKGTLNMYPEGTGSTKIKSGEAGVRTEADLVAWKRAHPRAIIDATSTSKMLRGIKENFKGFIAANESLFRDMYLKEELHGMGRRTASRRLAALRVLLSIV